MIRWTKKEIKSILELQVGGQPFPMKEIDNE